MAEISYLSCFQAGKEAFERGNYRKSIEQLDSAIKLVNPSSLQGGEVQMWLVTAYQAANRLPEAVALARKLTQHPNLEIRKQSKQLLYILEAPELKRPREWMTEIPDLTAPEQNNKIYQVKTNAQDKKSPTKKTISEGIPYHIPNQDNAFIWVALVVFLLTIGSLSIRFF